MLGCTEIVFITDLKEELFSLLIGSAAFLQSKLPIWWRETTGNSHKMTESEVANKTQPAGI